MPKAVPKADNWVCDYQPSTPVPGGGRPDLRLRSGQAANISKHIILESKRDSILPEQQLTKYKDHGTEVLIAVTKNRPEVTYKRLREIGVKSLRWQDFGRALRQTTIAGQLEKFLCQSFAEYLEETGMAYHENITAKHLNQIAMLLRKIATHGSTSFSGRQIFNYAHNCLGLLDDVQASLREVLPKLDQWSCWGPGYFHNPPEEAGGEIYHYLAFTFAYPPSWRGDYAWFSGGLKFHEGTNQWSIRYYKPKNRDILEINHRIASVSSKGVLDIEKMAKTMERAARK